MRMLCEIISNWSIYLSLQKIDWLETLEINDNEVNEQLVN